MLVGGSWRLVWCVASRAQDVLSVGGVGRARLCHWVGGGVLRLDSVVLVAATDRTVRLPRAPQ